MIVSHPRLLALGCALLIFPAGAMATTPPVSEETAERSAPDAADTPTEDAAADDKRICRYVKLDTASRRKTKVCRTTEEWRELNNPR
ncbi:MAG TPA: hypothetical protein VK913_11190 [Erythrobacter sp.]|nr:hypothetical protein [Erythrobacter sp.]